jgi:adenosine deaminase
MITHLHVHLEPNERKSGKLGRAKRSYQNAEQFFDQHDPNNSERLRVTLFDLETFIYDFHAEQRAQSVEYAELRLSPGRFCALGYSLRDVLASADRAVAPLESPTVRLILLLNRNSSPEYIEQCGIAISEGLPRTYVGIDLAGDEALSSDVDKYRNFFSCARAAGLGITVHAGEFGDLNSVWQAIDELGAERIGHGTAVGGCRALTARMRTDQILIEVSLTSNVALGAVQTLESHPLPWFVENDIPVCLNTDVPLHLGTTIRLEHQYARRILGAPDQTLAAMEMSARRKSFLDRR